MRQHLQQTGDFLRGVLSIPEREYGPAPWWAWMGEMTPATIDRNLKRFMAMEIYEIIPISLYGLQPEYMGRDYFDLFRHTCRRCREWGIKLWIYDEFNWPSGTCAGRVLRKFPAARQQLIQIDRNLKAFGRRAKPTWKIVTGNKFQLAAYGAEWAVNETGFLDPLNPAAVRTYIEMTHEAYKREVGNYFGDVIVGFFTDEPAVGHGVGNIHFPYTPGLFNLFQKKYGYDLRPRITAMAAEQPDSLRVRCDYWELVADLFKTHYFQQYATWCEKHKLKMTGHLLYEEILAGNLVKNGDMFAMLSEMQAPGIDLLGGATSHDLTDNSIRWDVTGKLIESVACFTNKERTLCEAFGCMPNSTTLLKYKRAADFLFHHGLSLINDNLFADSLSSFRKFCGTHGFWTPWIRHYRLFARHIRTMSYLNSGSQLATSVGMYYPGTDARARYFPPRSMFMGPYYTDAAWDATQQTIHQLVHGLLRRHWDHYLVFDQILRDAKAMPGGLRMQKFACRALIFPDIHYVSEEIEPALRRFVKAGGLMLCVGRVPAVLDQAGHVRNVRWGAAERVLEIRAGTDEIAAEVASALRARFKPPLTLIGTGASDVMATRRLTRAGEALFLTNFGERTADICLELKGAWRRVDTVNAEAGAFIADSERLLPNESRLFIRTGMRRMRTHAATAGQPLAAMRDEWELRLPDGNVVSLPMTIFKGKYTAQPPTDVGATTWTVPYAEQAAMELIPERSYWLRREIELHYRPKLLELVVDGCDVCDVFVNRRRIPAVKGRKPVWDDDNLCCDLRKAVRQGKNEILIRYTPARIRRFVSRLVPLNDLPPFVLRGDFLAASRLDRPDVTPALAALPGRVETGALHARGYPNFVGMAEYSQTVRLETIAGQVILDMGRQNDLFEVEINGRSAGVLGWPPYRLEVSDLLKRGNNRFVFRLYTTLGGILSRYYESIEQNKPPVGLRETPCLTGYAEPRHAGCMVV